MLSAFTNSFKIPELRTRILFTLGMIFICRVIANIPTPGVDATALQDFIRAQRQQTGVGFMGLYDMFSGGALQRFAVGSLGIMPYISASIILQLMTAVVPALERLAREGDVGRQKITQYTRYLTVILCIIQGFTMATVMQSPATLQALGIDRPVVVMDQIWLYRILTVITLTTGTMLMMWLGEQITDRGIGNGISMIITVNIISGLPAALQVALDMFRPVGDDPARFNIIEAIAMLTMLFLVIAGIVAMTQAQRKIPVQYAKRVVGRKVYGGQSTFMPLRVNYAGVMPIIFASAILMFAVKILQMIPIGFIGGIGRAMQYGSATYNIVYGLMILFFSYFWVATQFKPVQIADDLKKHGGYVPGIRPGKPTAEYLDRAMTRLTLAGAIFLTVIAVLPMVIHRQFGIPEIVASFFGGTSLLIMVGVMLDTMRQIESHLLMRHYDGFLKKGKLRSRR